MSHTPPIAQSPAPQDTDTFVSVSRMSYRGQQNPSPTRLAFSRKMEQQRSEEHRQRGPKFVAKSNYEMSFTNAVSPPRKRIDRPDRREIKHLKFESNSLSRTDFRSPSPTDYPEKIKGERKSVLHALPFTANSESRKAYVKHSIKSVPARKKEITRPFPHIPFTAVSTSQASYTAHELPPLVPR
jgi:hypothetical protein